MDDIQFAILQALSKNGKMKKEDAYAPSFIGIKFAQLKSQDRGTVLERFILHGFVKDDTNNECWMTDSGRDAFTQEVAHRKILKDKDDIDYKLKQISYDSTRVNKWLPLYAAFIALISGGVPLYIHSESKDAIQKTETTMPQIERLLQNQERMLQMQQQFQDSLRKILNGKVSPPA